MEPALLLADEPTGNLDSTNGRQVTALLRELATKHNQTIVMVTHDSEVAGHADRLVRLRDGLIEKDQLVDEGVAAVRERLADQGSQARRQNADDAVVFI